MVELASVGFQTEYQPSECAIECAKRKLGTGQSRYQAIEKWNSGNHAMKERGSDSDHVNLATPNGIAWCGLSEI